MLNYRYFSSLRVKLLNHLLFLFLTPYYLYLSSQGLHGFGSQDKLSSPLWFLVLFFVGIFVCVCVCFFFSPSQLQNVSQHIYLLFSLIFMLYLLIERILLFIDPLPVSFSLQAIVCTQQHISLLMVGTVCFPATFPNMLRPGTSSPVHSEHRVS